MEKPDLQSLEAKINALIKIGKKLADENKVLRENETSLKSECAALHEKNVLAQKRLETMIEQLKSMEINA
jgi:uncharacterized protein (TIGR02449 family)